MTDFQETIENLKEEDQARRQHYSFAYHVLPYFALTDTENFLKVLSSPQGKQALVDIWNMAGKDNAGKPLEDRDLCKPDGLSSNILKGEGCYHFVIQMPEPKKYAEAFFVVISVFEPEKDSAGNETTHPVRCFSLEHSLAPDENPRTAFCEWFYDEEKGQGRANYGSGPAPLEADLIRFIDAFLAQSEEEENSRE